MLSKLSSGLQTAISKLKRSTLVDKRLVEEVVRDLQRVLIAGDVNVQLVFEVSNRIKERAAKEKPLPGIPKKNFVIKIVYEELVSLLGKEESVKPGKLLMVGLFGSGKTTSCAKVAKYFLKKGYKPAMICTDTWRPAAMDQLEQLGKEINVPVYTDKKVKDPAKILAKGLEKFSSEDVLIVDSAGRDALDDKLVRELKEINKVLKPVEVLLVLSGDMGQTAGEQAKAFNEAVGLTGVIVTKLDSSAKGGGALTASASVGCPVKFIGVGEGTDALQEFDPQRFLGRLLGMPDLQAMVEKAEDVQKESELDVEAILSGKFSLKDFYNQLEATKKMGPLRQILGSMGLSNQIPENMLKVTEENMKKFKYIMDSMTKEELENPDIIKSDRINRIAKGSGTSTETVKLLLNQHKQSKKMVKMLKKGKRGKLGQLMRQFGVDM